MILKGLPIKFRAKALNEKIYFGSIRKYQKCYAISGTTSEGESSDGFFEVFEDTICQLVGYDANGNEIYEGDTLIDEDGKIFDAEFGDTVVAELFANVHLENYRKVVDNERHSH